MRSNDWSWVAAWIITVAVAFTAGETYGQKIQRERDASEGKTR